MALRDSEHFVDIKWWMRELGVCRRSVERYSATGVIPAPIRMNGKLLRWLRSSAEAHLAKMEREALVSG
jgi:predicted DNA-binding transcriptional regulator AlpA